MAVRHRDLNALIVDFTVFASAIDEPSASELQALVNTLLKTAAAMRSEQLTTNSEIATLKLENDLLREKLDSYSLTGSDGSGPSGSSASGSTDKFESSTLFPVLSPFLLHLTACRPSSFECADQARE